MALGFLVIPLFFVNGYFIRTIRHVSSGEKYRLPEWTDWGELLRTGFKLSLVMAIYFLPIVLIVAIFFVSFFGLTLFLDSLPKSQNGLLFFLPILSSILLQVFFQAVMVTVSIAIALWLPAVEIRLAQRGTIKGCFEFKELYQFIKYNIKDYFLIFLILFGVNYLSGLGMILFFVGILFTTFYAWMVGAHLKGQLLGETIQRISTQEK